MAKKTFGFDTKFENQTMQEEAWEDPRDKARRERKAQEAAEAAKKKGQFKAARQAYQDAAQAD